MSFLNANRRRRVREIAREEYLVASSVHPNPKRQPEGIGDIAIPTATTRIKNAAEYQSIVGQLLAAIAIKLAIALIEKWVKEQLVGQSVPKNFQPEEPGYAKTPR